MEKSPSGRGDAAVEGSQVELVGENPRRSRNCRAKDVDVRRVEELLGTEKKPVEIYDRDEETPTRESVGLSLSNRGEGEGGRGDLYATIYGSGIIIHGKKKNVPRARRNSRGVDRGADAPLGRAAKAPTTGIDHDFRSRRSFDVARASVRPVRSFGRK